MVTFNDNAVNKGDKQMNTTTRVQASDAFSVYIYKQWQAECLSVKDLCEQHGINIQLCNDLINQGRNLSSVDYQAVSSNW